MSNYITSIHALESSRLIVGDAAGSLYILDISPSKPEVLQNFKGHTETIEFIAALSDKKQFISVSADNLVMLWDISHEKPLTNFFAYDLFSGQLWFLNGEKKTLDADFFQSKTPGKSNATQYDYISCLATSPVGKWFIIGSGARVTLWDLSKQQDFLKNPNKDVKVFVGERTEVLSLAISPDGKWFLSGSKNGSIILRDIETFAQEIFTEHQGFKVESLAIFPDGKRFLSGSGEGSITLWTVNIYFFDFLGSQPTRRFHPIRIFKDYDNLATPFNIFSESMTVSEEDYHRPVKHITIFSNHQFLTAAINSKIQIWNIKDVTSYEALFEDILLVTRASEVLQENVAITMRDFNFLPNGQYLFLDNRDLEKICVYPPSKLFEMAIVTKIALLLHLARTDTENYSLLQMLLPELLTKIITLTSGYIFKKYTTNPEQFGSVDTFFRPAPKTENILTKTFSFLSTPINKSLSFFTSTPEERPAVESTTILESEEFHI